jgi:hypothetical protein
MSFGSVFQRSIVKSSALRFVTNALRLNGPGFSRTTPAAPAANSAAIGG